MSESRQQRVDRIMALLNRPQQERNVYIFTESIIGSGEPARVIDVIAWGGPPLTLEEKRQYFPTEEEWQEYLETITQRDSATPSES